MGSPVRCAGALYRSVPTSQKAAGNEVTTSSSAFLVIASGSANELDYELLLAKDLEYLGAPTYHSLHEDLSRLRKMLNALLQKVDGERSVAKL